MRYRGSLYYRYINIKVDIKYYLQKQLFGKYKKVVGNKYINKPMDERKFSELSEKVYGNKYIEENYTENEDEIFSRKQWIVNIIDRYLNTKGDLSIICDADANRGYLMKAFFDKGYKAYGFDILEDKSHILDNDNLKKNYKLGSILDIPHFDVTFDIVTCMNVFEHIPINFTDKMAEELLKLSPHYFVFEISKDAISAGHITLKNTRWWTKKFKGYRVMREINTKLKKEMTLSGECYQNTGVPRNHWNGVPGIVFLEKIE